MSTYSDMPDLMTPGEVAAVFRVDTKTVSRWAAAGRIPAIKTPGGHSRFHRADIHKALGHPASAAAVADPGEAQGGGAA